MGGDLGISVVVEGALRAARELGIASILVGDQKTVGAELKRFKATADDRVQVAHAPEVVGMDESPSLAIRGKSSSSVRMAFELVKDKRASAVVSAGNTGAMMAAGIYVCGTLPGIARPAIATLIPRVEEGTHTILLDSGANIDCHASQLVQFALMGNYYARCALYLERPRVALLSNGTEASKGNDIIRSAASTLCSIPEVNFVGYVEGRDIPRNRADVVVCDGFVGNVLLKAMEGCVELVLDSIKQYVEKSSRGKIGLWLAKPMFKQAYRAKLAPSAHGGAPLLGLTEVGVVCHGSSDGLAIFNAVRLAKRFVDESLVQNLRTALGAFDVQMAGNYESRLWNEVGKRFARKDKGKKTAHEQ